MLKHYRTSFIVTIETKIFAVTVTRAVKIWEYGQLML